VTRKSAAHDVAVYVDRFSLRDAEDVAITEADAVERLGGCGRLRVVPSKSSLHG